MTRPSAVPLIVVLTVAGLAGCFGDDSTSAGSEQAADPGLSFLPDWAEVALPFHDEHDHFDATHHQGLSTPNFDELGWNPLVSDHYGHTAGGHLCGDARDFSDKRLAVVHGYTTEVAFVLVDVTDATDPVVLGEFVTPRTSARDVALVPDGNHVVFAGTGPRQPEAPAEDEQPLEAPAYWRDACGTRPVRLAESVDGRSDLPLPAGAVLVDISDPDDMVIDAVFPVASPLGVHSISADEAGGQTLVMASVVNLAAPASNIYFLDVRETAAGTQLVYLSEYQDLPTDGGGSAINGHNDAWFQTHPVTGDPTVYVANWHQGMVILDMSDPRFPTVLGRWTDNPGPSGDLVQDGTGNYHEAFPLDTMWNGRHYTFVGQEILGHPSETSSGWLHVIDTTDPSSPSRVASWTLPVDVQWSASAQFSTHYVDFHGRTLFMAHYHAGVWAIDLSNLENETILPAVGVFIPANESPKPAPESLPYDWTPTIMDVNVLDNGDVVVWDARSGIYTVRFDASQPAPPYYFEGL